jgi:peroxiredoxin
MKPRVRFIPSAAAALAFILAAIPAPVLGQGQSLPQVGEKFPAFQGETLEGETVSLSDYRDKVVLIDFWATWCGPCVAEMPHVKEVYEEFHEEGFEVIGVSLDHKNAALEKWQADPKTRLPWPCIYEGGGWGTRLAKQFGINSIPATFLLNREGVLVASNLRGGQLQAEVSKLIRGDSKVLNEMFAEWTTADADRRKEIEATLPKIAERFQMTANEIAWVYLDEGKPARPSPKGAALMLKMLRPTIELDPKDKASKRSQTFAILDTAALAAHIAGNDALAAQLQTRAVEGWAKLLPENMPQEASGEVADLMVRQALYLAKTGETQKASEILTRVDSRQTPASPARRSKYHAQVVELLSQQAE